MFTLFRRLRARLKYRHFERDLQQEIEVHRSMKQDELERSGASATNARARAARSLGNTTYMREESRSVWVARWLEHAWQDVRYAMRQLRRFPSYSTGAILILAIGVATSTVAFSIVNATLLRPWPVDDPASLVIIETLQMPDGQYSTASAAEAQYLRDHASTVRDMATYMRGGVVIEEPRADIQSSAVTAAYFTALEIGTVKGRLLSDADARPGAPSVGLISYRLWQEAFQADPNIIGRIVRIASGPLTIVGVLAPGFDDVHRLRTGLWVPASGASNAVMQPVNIVARLAEGVDAARAQVELQALSRQFRTANQLPLPELSVRNTRPMNAPNKRGDLQQMLLLLPAAGLLMLLVCANVGGLILARTSARLRELAVRRALGASRGRVSRQVFTEVLVLALGAGILGVIGANALPVLLGDGMRTDQFSPDGSVFVVAFLLSVAAALMATMSALVRVSRINVSTFIARQHGAERSSARARAVLIATQLAISTTVLTAAGLMTRAVVHASAADPGFSVEGLEFFALHSGQVFRSTSAGGPELVPWVQLSERWRTEVRNLGAPGIALASQPPLSRSISPATVRRTSDHASLRTQISRRTISSSYFDVLGIRLVEGRTLSDAPGARELVVSEQAAKWLWPSEVALGRQLIVRASSSEQTYTVVGVAIDVATRSVGTTEPTIYMGCGLCSVVLTRNVEPAFSTQVTGAAARVDPSLRVIHGTARQNLSDEGTSDLQEATTAAWIVGLSALALSLIGAFGVLAYTVEERRREIGIRMALGGSAWPVALSVMAAANRPAIWGVGIGGAVAAAVAQFLRHEVFGLTPLDPMAYLLVALVLLPPIALAAALPARRATRVNPAITLRHD